MNRQLSIVLLWAVCSINLFHDDMIVPYMYVCSKDTVVYTCRWKHSLPHLNFNWGLTYPWLISSLCLVTMIKRCLRCPNCAVANIHVHVIIHYLFTCTSHLRQLIFSFFICLRCLSFFLSFFLSFSHLSIIMHRNIITSVDTNILVMLNPLPTVIEISVFVIKPI